MEAERSRKRRRYSRELKAQILAECDAPGASVAKVAMSHGVNANILHGWRKLARRAEPATRQEFVPVPVAPTAQVRPDERGIDIELRRDAVTIKLLWPMNAAAELAAFTREFAAVIRVDAVWMVVEPRDMRAGNHGSQVGEQALKFFGQLYDVEREVASSDAEHLASSATTAIKAGGRRAASIVEPAPQRCRTAHPPPARSTTA